VGPFMKVNGKKGRSMEEENKYGRMEQYMKVTGNIIRLMVMVD